MVINIIISLCGKIFYDATPAAIKSWQNMHLCVLFLSYSSYFVSGYSESGVGSGVTASATLTGTGNATAAIFFFFLCLTGHRYRSILVHVCCCCCYYSWCHQVACCSSILLSLFFHCSCFLPFCWAT